jgi:hypothetical protein
MGTITVASSARAARKQIHRYKYELSLPAEASRIALPAGISTSAIGQEDALVLLKAALSQVATLHAMTHSRWSRVRNGGGLRSLAFFFAGARLAPGFEEQS